MITVWTSTKKVSFASRGKVVVAWYCDKAADVETASAAKENIKKSCINDGNTNAPNTAEMKDANDCYNKLALKKVQEYRKTHFSYNAIASDLVRAAKLQKAMDAAADAAALKALNIAGVSADDDAKCSQSYYEGKAGAVLATSNEAAESWYKGHTAYDFAKGQAKEPGNAKAKAKADDFTRMIWNGATKAVFGVKGNVVIAWFCDAKPNEGDAAAFKKNVKAVCIKDGMNRCLNDGQLKLHNKYRRDYKDTPALLVNDDAAKAM
jgi:hypothetical protein